MKPAMKVIYALLLLVSTGLVLQAQRLSPEVLANAGGHGNQSNVQLSWTLGELSIATGTSSQNTLTQGFHQTQLVITEVEDAFPETWEVKAYPNPVSDLLHVSWGGTEETVGLRFTNMAGQVLLTDQVEGSATQVNVEQFPQGIYFLEVYTPAGTQGKTFKVEVVRH